MTRGVLWTLAAMVASVAGAETYSIKVCSQVNDTIIVALATASDGEFFQTHGPYYAPINGCSVIQENVSLPAYVTGYSMALGGVAVNNFGDDGEQPEFCFDHSMEQWRYDAFEFGCPGQAPFKPIVPEDCAAGVCTLKSVTRPAP